MIYEFDITYAEEPFGISRHMCTCTCECGNVCVPLCVCVHEREREIKKASWFCDSLMFFDCFLLIPLFSIETFVLWMKTFVVQIDGWSELLFVMSLNFPEFIRLHRRLYQLLPTRASPHGLERSTHAKTTPFKNKSPSITNYKGAIQVHWKETINMKPKSSTS